MTNRCQDLLTTSSLNFVLSPFILLCRCIYIHDIVLNSELLFMNSRRLDLVFIPEKTEQYSRLFSTTITLDNRSAAAETAHSAEHLCGLKMNFTVMRHTKESLH